MIAKLIAIEGPDKGLEFTFDKGTEWIIGRNPEKCQFVLSDPKASEQQAVIREESGQYYIKNLSDSLPTQIGNNPVTQEQQLHYEDRIKLGETWFRFTETKVTSKDAEYDNFFDDSDTDAEDFVPEAPPANRTPQENPPSNENKQPQTPSNQKNEEDKEEGNYDTIFEDLGDQETFSDLSDQYLGSERFILKVLAGPNAGAEFAMQKGRSYIIGTDVIGADIIFNDLSVSRHHARLSLTDEAEILIEDLKSRNGVIVDGAQIEGQHTITPKNMVTLGTTTFIVLDREHGEETLITKPVEKKSEEKPQKEIKEEVKVKETSHRSIRESTFILTGVLVALLVVFGVGAVTLFKTSPVEHPKIDFTKEIQQALGNDYPDVKYTFTPSSGTLFILGHVLTTVDKEELLYTLNNLSFIGTIEDNVVVDDAVGQEMNLVLSRYPNWRSISIHSPQPGRFVMSGYLPTREQWADLEDFVNVQFPYVDRLCNYVIIEEDLNQDILSKLHNYGFYNIQLDLNNGEVTLSGYINAAYEAALCKTIREVSRIAGVRNVNNYVVVVCQNKQQCEQTAQLPYSSEGSPGSIGQPGEPAQSAAAVKQKFGSWVQDDCVVNLTDYQDQAMDVTPMYTVTGYADQGPVGRAVVIKGRILTVGDTLNGMKVLAILDQYVFLEKNGLKYKIEFNR